MAVIINESEVRKTVALMKPNNEAFEIRIIYGNKLTYSGYFNSADALMTAFDRDIQDYADCNIYMTVNALNDGCMARDQRNRFLRNPKATTSDKDVTGYEWLFIDLDPERPSGTSSTDSQLAIAKDIGNKIYVFMKQIGFNKPLMAYSGNGVHLMYRIRLQNNDENKKLVEKCLKTLDMLFSTDAVKVDVKNYNPARVAKLYGTLAQKGCPSEEYPHRMSRIVSDGEVLKNDIAYLQKLVSYYPQEEKPQAYNNYRPRDFDLETWLNKYGIGYQKTSFSDGYKYILSECPFDSNHKGKDACLFQGRDGRIGFHCFHNSCADKKWRDFRLLYEPDAYEKRQQDYEKKIYGKFNRDRVEPRHIVEQSEKPVFQSAKMIFDKPEEPATYIRTGIEVIDKRLRGLAKGDVSLVSGLRASAKSTLLTQWALEAVNAGNNVAVFSGELRDKRFMRWMFQIAAGKGYVEPSQYPGYYNVPRNIQAKIAEWLGDRFWLYDNDYGNDFQAVIEQFEKAVEEKKLDLLILDNLMAFDIRSLSENKFEAQTQFILRIVDLAKKKNVHICFVAHPRKALGFLRLDDVSGSADLANAVDDAFIVHRNNNDFKRLSKQMFGWHDDEDVYFGTNVVEIAKDRDGGTQDVFIPLYYEQESKRLRNDPTENRQYGWQDDEFEDVMIADIPF